MEFEIETHVKTLHQHCTLHMSRSQSVDYWKKATLIERTANARCLFKLFSPPSLVYLQSTHTRLQSIK